MTTSEDDRLVLGAHLGELLGVSRARGYQIAADTEDFPKPKHFTGPNGDQPLWSVKAVLRWQAKKKKA